MVPRSVLLLVGVALAAVPRDEGIDVELALAALVVHVPETNLGYTKNSF